MTCYDLVCLGTGRVRVDGGEELSPLAKFLTPMCYSFSPRGSIKPLCRFLATSSFFSQ